MAVSLNVIVNPFKNFSLAELLELRAAYKQCLLDIATAGVSYTITGRTHTRANLQDVKDTLGEISDAIDLLNNKAVKFATPIFHGSLAPMERT